MVCYNSDLDGSQQESDSLNIKQRPPKQELSVRFQKVESLRPSRGEMSDVFSGNLGDRTIVKGQGSLWYNSGS